jgi:polysaccharide biosynthesis transport protein
MLRKVENPVYQTVVISGEEESFAALRNLLRRQFRVILFAVLFAIGLGAVYALTTPPSFTAVATLFIDARKVPVFDKQSPAGVDLLPDMQVVDSQVEILKSQGITSSVIQQFHLAEDPEFIGPRAGLLATLKKSVSDLRDRFRPRPAVVESKEELAYHAAKTFADRLTVRRVGATSVIEVSFQADNPGRAAEIANAIVDAYIKQQVEGKSDAAKRFGSWLQDRIQELSEQAAAAERAVVEYKAKNNIVTVESVTGQRLLNEQQLGELNSQLVVARANTADAKAHLDRIQEIISGGVPDATVTDTLKSEIVSKLRLQYLDLAAREADWSARYGANHLAAVNLRNQMGEIRASIVAELQRLAETYKSDYQIAQQREESMKGELTAAVSQSHTDSQAQISLRELQGTAQTYRTLHDNFVQRYMESVQQQSFAIAEARMIASASPPLKPSRPKPLLDLAIAGALGLMFGFGVAQLRELLDRVFRTRAQVEAKLYKGCVAVVPALAEAPIKMQTSSVVTQTSSVVSAVTQASSVDKKAVGGVGDAALKTLARLKAPLKTMARLQAPTWHVLDSPFSRFTEAMRAIKLAIDLKEASTPNRVIGFTSTLPNEGKSTIAASLAQLIAHAGQSTILVDCDLRNPSLTCLLAPSATIGFFDVIKGDVPLEAAVFIDQATGLEFLPQSMKTRFAHTNEALASRATNALFDQLRERYEYILVDCSPLTPIVDVRATTLFVDSFVYVIEWGRTKRDVVEHALCDAVEVYEKVVCAVLNKVDMSALGRYDGYGASYYHNKHYSRYGYTD